MVSNEEIIERLRDLKISIDNHNVMLENIASSLDVNNADTAEIKGVIVRGKTTVEYLKELAINVVANKL